MKTQTAEAAARIARLPPERRPPLHSHQYELKVHCDRKGHYLHHRSTPWEGPIEPKWLRDMEPASTEDEIATRSTQHPWRPTRREDHTDHYSYMLSKTGGATRSVGGSLFDATGRYLSTTALRTGLGATHSFDTEADITAHLHSTYRTDFCREGPTVATVRDVPPLTPIYRKVPAGDGTVFVDDQPYYPRLSTAFGLGYGKSHSMHRNYLHVDEADGGNSLVATLNPNGASNRSLGGQHVLGRHTSAPSPSPISPSASASAARPRSSTSGSGSSGVLASAAASTFRGSASPSFSSSSPQAGPSSPNEPLPPRPRRLPATRRTGPI